MSYSANTKTFFFWQLTEIEQDDTEVRIILQIKQMFISVILKYSPR